MEPQTPSTALDPTKVYDTLNLALKIAASIAKLTPTELDDTVVATLRRSRLSPKLVSPVPRTSIKQTATPRLSNEAISSER